MRKKFGSSSGLSNKGNMQGIGSDPSYKQSSGQNSINMPLDVNDIVEASQNALTFFSTTFTGLGDQITKVLINLLYLPINLYSIVLQTTQQYLDSSQNNDSGTNDTWSSVSSAAFTFWKQANDFSTGLIDQIGKDENVDYHFPRPEEIQMEKNSIKSDSRNPSNFENTISNNSTTQQERIRRQEVQNNDDFFANFGL